MCKKKLNVGNNLINIKIPKQPLIIVGILIIDVIRICITFIHVDDNYRPQGPYLRKSTNGFPLFVY